MKREPGFYWVKFENEDWQIAQYNGRGNFWNVLFDRDLFNDNHFSEIDERRIVREEVAKQRMGNNGLRRVL